MAIFFITIFGFSCSVYSQVDQRWLRSWNEAIKMKPAEIAATGSIAPKDEPGEPLVIRGRIYTPDNTPATAVLIHAYHRDSKGFDFGKNDSELTTWRLQGWAKTDQDGFFTFKTIRPAPDHIGREGPHIHFTVVSESYGRQWAPTVFFSDDPSLSASQRNESKKAGRFGWIAQVNKENGVQTITINIRLKESGDF